MSMTSRERILTTLSHKEPDRVPLILNPSMHPARDRGIPLKEYFSSPELVAEGIMTAREKYGTDAYIGFHYTPAEYEAFGGDVIFREDGPPNSGRPIISSGEQIDNLTVPVVAGVEPLQRVLETIRIIKRRNPDNALIFGVAVSPFSLPVMQMGFEDYIRLIYSDEKRLKKLLSVNSQFFLDWATSQIQAGADGIIYFDPVSSPLIIPPELYRRTGLIIAREMITRINAPIAAAYASARVLPILEDIISTGVIAIGVGGSEDLGVVKERCAGRVTVIGNLNGIEMRHWTREEAFLNVRAAITDAASGGGFILSDNHGEIPVQVPDEVLYAIRDAVREYGRYPAFVR